MTEAEHLAFCANIPLTLACIVVMGANRHNLSLKMVRSDLRRKTLTRVRWEIAAAARQFDTGGKPFSLPQIGRALNRDHTTIIHGLAMWKKSAQKEGDGQPPSRPSRISDGAANVCLPYTNAV